METFERGIGSSSHGSEPVDLGNPPTIDFPSLNQPPKADSDADEQSSGARGRVEGYDVVAPGNDSIRRRRIGLPRHVARC